MKRKGVARCFGDGRHRFAVGPADSVQSGAQTRPDPVEDHIPKAGRS